MDAWKLLLARGGVPNEVIIKRDGTRIPGADALKKDMQWDTIYFREDGWTIAAEIYLSHYVRATCTDPEKPWTGKIDRGWKVPKPF